MARASAAFSTWANLRKWRYKGWLSSARPIEARACSFFFFFSGPAHRRLPVEGSVRLVLEHLVEVFQRFHLSCCLAGQYTVSLNHSRVLDWRLRVAQADALTLVSESRLVTVGSERISEKKKQQRSQILFFSLSTVILGWDCDDLCVINCQSVPLSEYLWPDDECTSMNLGRFSSRTLLSCRTASL